MEPGSGSDAWNREAHRVMDASHYRHGTGSIRRDSRARRRRMGETPAAPGRTGWTARGGTHRSRVVPVTGVGAQWYGVAPGQRPPGQGDPARHVEELKSFRAEAEAMLKPK